MYIVTYDIAAVVLTILTAGLYFRQRVDGLAQNRIYGFLLGATALSSTFDLLSSIAINALPASSRALTIALTTVYYLSHASLTPLVAVYLYAGTAGLPGKHSRQYFVLLPWLVSIIMILVNPFFPTLFFIDGAGTYRHGLGLVILYVFAAGYAILAALEIISETASRSRSRKAVLLACLALPFCATFIQLYVPGLMLECFFASLGVLFLFLTMQSAKTMVDGQTGVLTRKTFEQMLGQLIGRKERFSILVVYSADFPGLQELLDFNIYRKLSRSFASWISLTAGRTSPVCILEDGVFAVFSGKRTDPSAMGFLALDILERAKSVWEIDSIQIELQVQVGVLRYPDEISSVTDAIDRISEIIRVSGLISDRHVFYTNDIVPGRSKLKAIAANGLKKMIDRGNPELRFQPFYSVDEGKTVALEVLIGLTTETGEWLAQSDVLKLANEMGISRKLGRLVFERACDWYSQNRIYDLGIESLQIRLLESQCMDINWADEIIAIMNKYQMQGSWLCLEITETTVSAAGETLRSGMETLEERGVKFAVDDFGTGYTDLGPLLKMPFSLVKLDKMVVQEGLCSKKGKHLLSGSVSMFKILNYRIAAEGIETPEQADMLIWAGSDYLQGYYFGYPVPGDEILAMRADRIDRHMTHGD
jgi:EAL domain-containing protein (putative c-di-GMP-specific phosphodiesterase class I)/GGDEF domain-containing protein